MFSQGLLVPEPSEPSLASERKVIYNCKLFYYLDSKETFSFCLVQVRVVLLRELYLFCSSSPLNRI